MSVEVYRSDRSRHLVLRQSGGDLLPGAILEKLLDEGVACGWLRASGVLADVELRVHDARIGGLGAARLIVGPVQALVIEGAIGLVDGVPSCSLRALLSREGDAGLEVLAGEIESARAISLEVLVTALDDVALGRSFDPVAGVWLLGGSGATGSHGSPRASGGAAPARAWATALAASEGSDRDVRTAAAAAAGPGAAASAPAGMKMPQKPARPQAVDVDSPVPDVGDLAEHFAFGLCDVVKSDGDRLHLRVIKDGRIKEIALEMLRVTRLDSTEPPTLRDDGEPRRRFKLDRKM
jgi:hypothetical protein